MLWQKKVLWVPGGPASKGALRPSLTIKSQVVFKYHLNAHDLCGHIVSGFVLFCDNIELRFFCTICD